MVSSQFNSLGPRGLLIRVDIMAEKLVALTHQDEDPSFDLSNKTRGHIMLQYVECICLENVVQNRVQYRRELHWSLVYSFSRFHDDHIMVVVPSTVATCQDPTARFRF